MSQSKEAEGMSSLENTN